MQYFECKFFRVDFKIRSFPFSCSFAKNLMPRSQLGRWLGQQIILVSTAQDSNHNLVTLIWVLKTRKLICDDLSENYLTIKFISYFYCHNWTEKNIFQSVCKKELITIVNASEAVTIAPLVYLCCCRRSFVRKVKFRTNPLFFIFIFSYEI